MPWLGQRPEEPRTARSSAPRGKPHSVRSVSPRDSELQLWAEMRTLSSLFLLTPPSSPQNLSSLVPLRSGQVPINFTQLAQPNSDGCRPNPCPDAELAERLQSLIERYSFIGRSFEAPAEKYGEGYLPAVAHQLRVLIADLAVFLADLGRAIEGR